MRRTTVRRTYYDPEELSDEGTGNIYIFVFKINGTSYVLDYQHSFTTDTSVCSPMIITQQEY